MVTIPGTSPYDDSYVIKFPDGDISLERNISSISTDYQYTPYLKEKPYRTLPSSTMVILDFGE